MSKLERFLGKPKKVKIAGEEIELKPLTVKNLDIITKLGDKETRGEGMKELIITTLKKSFPDEKIEDIEEFSLEYFEDLVNGILEVNNLQMDEKTKKKALEEMNLPK